MRWLSSLLHLSTLREVPQRESQGTLAHLVDVRAIYSLVLHNSGQSRLTYSHISKARKVSNDLVNVFRDKR